MRSKVFLIFAFLVASTALQAQSDDALLNLHLGFLGSYLSFETKLYNDFATRVETGIDAAYFEDNISQSHGLIFGPTLNVEQRYYYNFRRRVSRQKDVALHSANFVVVAISYHPDLFVISNNKNINIPNQILLSPRWALRRNLFGSNFTFEGGAGVSCRFYLDNQNLYKQGDGSIDLYLRIGYTINLHSKK